MSPKEIFDGAAKGDRLLKKVVDTYIRRLEIGIVNIVNIFRPQLVILGGELSEQGKTLTASLRAIVKEGCFGGDKGELPEIEVAALGKEAGIIGAASLI